MKLLDVGCGPTLANALAATRNINYVVLSDLTQKNRREMKKAVHNSPGAIDWSLNAQSQARREGHM